MANQVRHLIPIKISIVILHTVLQQLHRPNASHNSLPHCNDNILAAVMSAS